jgi:molybdenum cofactor cytidylyltransferase
MGHSIAAGVWRLTTESQAKAVAIFLADMPLINRDTLEALLASAAPDSIVIPSYRGTRGHPVLFGKRFWPSLSELSGDGGARSVIDSFPEALHLLELDDPGILLDVDTPQDWHALLTSRD